jgi:hypothetical protein
LLKDKASLILKSMPQYWFKAKRYGWGWRPASWQGWLSIFVYILLVVLIFTKIDQNSATINDSLLTFIPQVLLLTLILLLISYIKGERPNWRWGSPKKKK